MATMAAQQKPGVPQAEINWDRLDKTKFYLVGAGLFSGVSAALYPITVVKTRMQVARGEAVNMKAPAIVRSILSTDGVRGLYRGFGTVVAGTVPSRVVFLTTLETTKIAALNLTSKLNFPDTTAAAIANGAAGFLSSVVSQFIFVPLDVVSQRLMVQGTPGSTKYAGGIDAVRQIVKADGIRGLYRGFGMSVITYSPTSGVWWASYGTSQRVFWRALGYTEETHKIPSQSEMVLVQAAGGLVAAACASALTAPFDTIKTRLQVLSSEGNPTVVGTARQLLQDDGWKGLYRGLVPRFLSMTLWGSAMIISYEYLKRLSVKKDDPIMST
ncbi:solute carrier family 25 member 44 [Selaginella moellendorffii]|nr:solute carrier family 25 member 44 [Selaginella moellendorffii]XP_024531473.1 solute carrier family 25 member 44 [Selaginella moellendorffii]|eukprot:XP_024531472.1 solute carrier family 25 member 44 [Selaginella moellendorffii]